MPSHLTRLFEALSLVILATVVIAGLLSMHSVASLHAADSGHSTTSSATIDIHAGLYAEAANVDGASSTVADLCGVLSNPECCTEPVACIENATTVPVVLASLTSPAYAYSAPERPAPASVDQLNTAPAASPSLTLLSISRV